MKKCFVKLLVWIFLFVSINFVRAQTNPETEWHSKSSIMNAMVTDNNGNIYVTGQTNVRPIRKSYCVTIKYDKDGNEIWKRKYNETIATPVCFGLDIILDNNKNVIVKGRSNRNSYIILKYDNNGNTLWEKDINTNLPTAYGFFLIDRSKGLVVDKDNNIYLANADAEPNTRHFMRTIKLNPSGDYIWERIYFLYNPVEPRGMVIDNDSNIYITGTKKVGNNGLTAFTLKYSSNGDLIWDKTFRPNRTLAHARGITLLKNNHLSVVGMADEIAAPYTRKAFIVNYDSSGNELWSHVIDSSYYSGHIAFLKSLQDNLNNIIVAGSVQAKYFVVKYSMNGDLLWHNKLGIGGPGSERNLALDSQNNSYITGMSTKYDTVKLNPSGEMTWHHSYGPDTHWRYGNDIKINRFGLFVTGTNGTIKIKTNSNPIAKCKDIEISADDNCHANIQPDDIDNGSFDPDEGDNITLSISSNESLTLGTHYIILTATDSNGASDTCISTVTVKDRSIPVIDSLAVSKEILWPVNHKMIPITIFAQVFDNCDNNPTVKIISVTSNESNNGNGDGNTYPDWEITGDMTVNLRAERSGNGEGRIYTITVQCTDESGNSSTKDVIVTVPHNKKGIK